MPLFRNEFSKTLIRLRLMHDDLSDSGFTETAEALNDAISYLSNIDNIYIQELARKKQARGKS